MMNSINTIIFDLDDTLYPEWQYQISGFKAVSEYLGSIYKINKDTFFKFLKRDYFQGNKRKNYNRLIKKFELKEDVFSLVELHRNHKPEIILYPDAENLLRAIRGKYRLGIITDGYSVAQQNKIECLNLEDLFDQIIVTDLEGPKYWKPNKKPFIKILKALSVKPEESIYVGDNPRKDFIAPNVLGMITIQIIRQDGEYRSVKVSKKEYQPIYKIDNLMNILDLLR